MPSRRSPIADIATIAVLAPRVVHARLDPLIRAAPRTRPGDQRELFTMVLEKWIAAQQSGWAIASAWMALPLRFWTSFLVGTSVSSRPSVAGVYEVWRGFDRVAAAGLAPIARRVSANARRLKRR